MPTEATPAPAGIFKPHADREVLVAGSLAFDQIMAFPGKFQDHILPDKLHMINLSFLVEERRIRKGGCAGNIAYGMALLGERARVVASAGNDFGDYRAFLEELGVDLSQVRIYDEPTAACFITSDRANNQITGIHPGAMSRARELSMAAAAEGRSPAYAIVAPDDPEAMVRHCREAKEAGVPLLFDPSFQVIAFDGGPLREMADGADFVLLNDYELSIFQDKVGVDDAGCLELAPVWVVTLGEQGSRILRRDGDPIDVPAAPVRTEVLDPTGAGDAYRAGFLAGLLRGLDLGVCGRLGAVSAVYAVEQYGTQTHHFTPAEFEERYRESFG
jgi:adenosine kinase